MKITFNITYFTEWGESLYVCGNIPELGNGDVRNAVEMNLIRQGCWQLSIFTDHDPGEFDYTYIVKAPEKKWRYEWGMPNHFISGKNIKVYNLFDAWRDTPANKPFYSSAFTEGMLRRQFKDQQLKPTPNTLCFRIEAPVVNPDERLVITGEGDMLGNWDPKHGIKMNDAQFPLWEVDIPLNEISGPFEYKFVVVKKKSGEVVRWEEGNNRHFGISDYRTDDFIAINNLRFAAKTEQWKAAGTAIPLFSIRTEEDMGIGDFCDLKKMTDWCAATGQKILQILPINDTTMSKTWLDSYPYKANSTFALHPIYINLKATGTLKDKKRREYYKAKSDELYALADVDYEKVMGVKEEYLHEIFDEAGDNTLNSKEFKTFFSRNAYWLKPYAAWNLLRENFATADHHLWKEFATYDEEAVENLIQQNQQEINFYFYVQFHLDKQLRSAKEYAHSKGVVIKGDIPIGISRFSVDAWKSPELFNLDSQAGAPPDDFSILGQNWEFPTYNWEVMAKDWFKWWRDRFSKMAEYFDAYRIDHILGFFRIWEIPREAIHGLLGYFNPALPFSPSEMRDQFDFWIDIERYTNPLITEARINELFNKDADFVKMHYLDRMYGDRYCLKPCVNTQRRIAEYFNSLEPSEKNDKIKEILIDLLDDVLFIEDPYQKGKFHPRITAQNTYQFSSLSDYEKWCFNRLYDNFFYHRHNEFWKQKAMMKLPPLLNATSMLTCAEDLGMIPACVPQVMDDLKILALEIQRMPKASGVEFADTQSYPYYSVCATSTHDMPGIRDWWESDRSRAERFFHNILHEPANAPLTAEPWICEKIIDQHLDSPSILAILPIQDWLSINGDLRRKNPKEEQINEPSNPQNYWKYRMHLSVESLIRNVDFNSALRNKIVHFNR